MLEFMQANTFAPLLPGEELAVNGVALNYTRAISDDHFPTMVLIHGFGATLHTWHDLYPLLTRRYSVVRLDLKGSGFSSKPQDKSYGPDDQAVLVTAFIQSLGLAKVLLVGHSLGGDIALLTYLGLRSGGRDNAIKGLVLIDSAGYPQKIPSYIAAVRNPLTRFISNLLSPQQRARYVLKKIFWDKRQVTPERVHRYAFFLDLPGSRQALSETARRIEPQHFQKVKERLGQIKIPTLLIWGRDDPVVPVENAYQFHKNIPNSQLEVLLETGHVPQEERPDAVFQLIDAFVRLMR